MNCEQALLLLSGHLDGQNTSEEEAALQAHLSECEECRAILEAYKAADAAVLSMEAEPPAALFEGVMERIAQDCAQAKAPKKRRFMFGAGTAVTAVAAVLLLLIGTGNLKNLQLGKASTADGLGAQPSAMSVDAPEEGSKVRSVPDDSAAPQVAQFAAPELEAESRADGIALYDDPAVLQLVIEDDVQQTALSAITALAGLVTLEDPDGNLWYVTDSSTVKAIQNDFSAQYQMKTLNDGGDGTICIVRILVPQQP